MKIIFASGNENKLREIREIMGDLAEEIVSMKEAGVFADPDETGSTFEENARIKAEACAALVRASRRFADDTIVMADDSGLEIDALGGEPGIHSARYMGHETPYDEKNRALLERLRDVPDEKRSARFVCAVAAVIVPGRDVADAVADAGALRSGKADGVSTNAEEPRGGKADGTLPEAKILVVRETMEGRIAHEIAGANGFGYDPIFFLPEYGKTSAEIAPEEKNAISHRGKALREMRRLLSERLGAER